MCETAFAMLGLALSALALALDELETGSELEALRGDPRWPGLLAHATTVFAAWARRSEVRSYGASSCGSGKRIRPQDLRPTSEPPDSSLRDHPC